MHATSTQRLVDHGAAAKAALATAIFVAGLAFGAVLGINVAPLAAPAPVSFQALDPDATGFRLHRDGEIGLGGATTNALRDQRNGEINAGADPASGALRAQRRGEIGADAP